jgi:membrane fusion protein (multidrug efflux system)
LPASPRVLLLGVLPGLLAVLALGLYVMSGRYVTTDNAYVGAQKVLITPEVSGKVVRISVVEGQRLKPGDELLAVDPEPFRLAVADAEAKLASVTTDYQSVRTNLDSLTRQVALSTSNEAAAAADFERKTALLKDRYSAPSDVDKAKMIMLAARAQLEQLRQQESAARNQLRGEPDLPLEKYPPYLAAKVALDRAERDLKNSVLRAPIAGVATQVASIQMGRFLTAGTAVFSMIDVDGAWVDANPKETDLTYVRPGQKVTITVDAFPSKEWHGTVAALSPGTGAQFAILPPQNASGNWVKVVQRVPVRIALDPGSDTRRLAAGMSVYVSIDTGRRGWVASLVGSPAVAESSDP